MSRTLAAFGFVFCGNFFALIFVNHEKNFVFFERSERCNRGTTETNKQENGEKEPRCFFHRAQNTGFMTN